MKTPARLLLMTLITLLFVSGAQAESSAQATPDSCHKFVEEFFAWYLPKALDMKLRVPAVQIALQQRPAAFAPLLVKALKEDAAAQAKVKGDNVGLDFDPILNAQDPADHYAIGAGALEGKTCKVPVTATEPRQGTRTKPDIVAEACFDNGWTFTNFIYPAANDDLLSVLKRLAEARREMASPKAAK